MITRSRVGPHHPHPARLRGGRKPGACRLTASPAIHVGAARLRQTTTPYTGGGTVNQTLFNGFQTANRTRVAESQVSAAREGLRVMEQQVLLSAATAYMDVLRDTANLEVQRTNVRVLDETLKQTRDRFNVGEVTRTDVAQAEAQLAAGQSAVATAESTLNTSRAAYRQGSGGQRAASQRVNERSCQRRCRAGLLFVPS
jgi:outer membrane protein